MTTPFKVYTKAELLDIVEHDPNPKRRHVAGKMLYDLGDQERLEKTLQSLRPLGGHKEARAHA